MGLIEYFNSYALFPSEELNLNTDAINKSLNQKVKHLNQLLRKAVRDGFEVIYNKEKFQSFDSNIATCGKHVILRLIMFLENNLDLEKYIRFMNILKNKLGMTSDRVVTLLVQKHD